MPPTPTPDTFRLTFASEVRALRSDAGKPAVITGKIVYDQRSKPIAGYFYEIVRRGAFAGALTGKDDVRGLYNHDDRMILGRLSAKTLRLFDDADGLRYEIDVPDTSYGKDLLISIERGDLNQSSFGFRKIRDKWSEERTADGILVEVRELLEVELFDVSPVAFPAYTESSVAMRCLDERRKAKAAENPKLRAARVRLAEVE